LPIGHQKGGKKEKNDLRNVSHNSPTTINSCAAAQVAKPNYNATTNPAFDNTPVVQKQAPVVWSTSGHEKSGFGDLGGKYMTNSISNSDPQHNASFDLSFNQDKSLSKAVMKPRMTSSRVPTPNTNHINNFQSASYV